MNTCEEFEIAIEMRRRGALDEARRAELAAHLATCESCRRFEAETTSAAAALRRTPAPLNKRPAWYQLRERLLTVKEVQRAAFFQALGPLIMGTALYLIASGLRYTILVIPPVVWFVISRMGAQKTKEWQSEAARAAETDEELLAFYKKSLDRRIATVRQDRKSLPFIVLALGLLFAWLGWWKTPERITAIVAILATLLSFALKSHFFDLPILLRERRELE
jgi:hypothetical protein